MLRSSWVGRLCPRSSWRGLQRIQYCDVRTSLFNNGVKGVGMGMGMGVGICIDAAAYALVEVGEGGKRPENKETRTNMYIWKG